MFAEIIKLRPDWAGTKIKNDEGKEVGYNHEDGAIRIIMTGSATEASDIQQHVFTKRNKKCLEKRFKDPDDPLKIVIVRELGDVTLRKIAVEVTEKLKASTTVDWQHRESDFSTSQNDYIFS